jgi:enoyl-CoA hydratase/carnithine racemase
MDPSYVGPPQARIVREGDGVLILGIEPDVIQSGMLRLEVAEAIGSVVIDRPAKRNALSEEMWAELPALMARLSEDERVGAIVFRSDDPRVFSAGADLSDLQRGVEDPSRAERGLDVIRAGFEAVRSVDKPTLAAIRGACHGGGAGLAVSCDLRLADTTAVFSIPPARLGLVYPFPALRRLMWLVGEGQAKRLLFTAAVFDAVEAARIGFVDEVVEPAGLEARIEEMARSLSAVSRTSVRSTKRVMGLIEEADPDAAATARLLEMQALAGGDHAEGLAALLDKREPRFPDV